MTPADQVPGASGATSPVDSLIPGRIGRVVRLAAKPGMRPALLDLVHQYIDALPVQEPGTEMFLVSTDPGAADVVWLIEWFRDAEAEREHRSSEAFAELMELMPALLESPPGLVAFSPVRMHMTRNVLDIDPFASGPYEQG